MFTYDGCDYVGSVWKLTAQGVHDDDSTERVSNEDNGSVRAGDEVVLRSRNHQGSGHLGLVHGVIVGNDVLVSVWESSGDVVHQSFQKTDFIVGAG